MCPELCHPLLQSDAFLEAFRSHAAAQIGARTQSLELQQELSTLLAAAVQQQVCCVLHTLRGL